MDPPLPTPTPLDPGDTLSDLRNSFTTFPRLQPTSSSCTTHQTSMPLPEDSASHQMYSEPRSQDGSARGTLGQFSFAPATQKTVVTTITTTTTSFPPLLIREPRHMHELDPKLYPLASVPTPASLKKQSFSFGGIPVQFQEAEDTAKALARVSFLSCFSDSCQ